MKKFFTFLAMAAVAALMAVSCGKEGKGTGLAGSYAVDTANPITLTFASKEGQIDFGDGMILKDSDLKAMFDEQMATIDLEGAYLKIEDVDVQNGKVLISAYTRYEEEITLNGSIEATYKDGQLHISVSEEGISLDFAFNAVRNGNKLSLSAGKDQIFPILMTILSIPDLGLDEPTMAIIESVIEQIDTLDIAINFVTTSVPLE